MSKRFSNGPLISFLIPVYNVKRYVAEALDSALSQYYNNIEIVVVDDYSTDGTYELILQRYKNNNRVRIFRTASNGGIVKALNLGLQFCTGDFIARLDGDDLVSKDKIMRQYEFLVSNPDVGVVGTNITLIDELGGIKGLMRLPISHDQILGTVGLGNPLIHIWLARKEVYMNLLGYRSVAPVEDYDFILRAIASGVRVANIPDALSYVRLRRGNTLTTSSLKQILAFKYVSKCFFQGTLESNSFFYHFHIKTQPSSIEQFFHSMAVRCMMKAFSQDKIYHKIIWLFLSLVSPRNFYSLFHRIVFKYKVSKVYK